MAERLYDTTLRLLEERLRALDKDLTTQSAESKKILDAKQDCDARIRDTINQINDIRSSIRVLEETEIEHAKSR